MSGIEDNVADKLPWESGGRTVEHMREIAKFGGRAKWKNATREQLRRFCRDGGIASGKTVHARERGLKRAAVLSPERRMEISMMGVAARQAKRASKKKAAQEQERPCGGI